MRADFGNFKPLKYRPSIKNSASLDFDPKETLDKLMTQKLKSSVNRDLVLNNIRKFLVETGKKM